MPPAHYCVPMPIRRRLSRHGDVALAAIIGTVFLVEIFTEKGFSGQQPVSVLAAVSFCAALAWRRRQPLVPMVLALVVIEVSNLAGPQALAETGAFLFGVIITIYSTGAYAEGRSLIAAAVLVGAAIPLAGIEPGESFNLADLAFFLMFFGGPFVAGRAIRMRRARERALEGRTVELEREGEERARIAVTEERARMARELHDVISHAVSVMLLQARGARRVLSEEEGQVRDALDTIERSGRQALGEMRRLLSVLREYDEDLALAPQPSLSRIGDLVERVRDAGLPVELSVQGELNDLPPGVDVSAYRIVQEGLTNALRHAGPTRAQVMIRRSPEELGIEVIDDGKGTGADGGSGHGLVGMRERVAVYGGRLEAGRRPQGGFALSAHLPLGSAS
jgi:signal transduction histidine kinase